MNNPDITIAFSEFMNANTDFDDNSKNDFVNQEIEVTKLGSVCTKMEQLKRMTLKSDNKLWVHGRRKNLSIYSREGGTISGTFDSFGTKEKEIF